MFGHTWGRSRVAPVVNLFECASNMTVESAAELLAGMLTDCTLKS